MAYTAGFSVNVGDPTKASDVSTLAANDDFLKNAIDTFIANDANNRVLTGTGSGTANGEANLTFDGSTLALTGAQTISSTLGVTGATTLSSDVGIGTSASASNRLTLSGNQVILAGGELKLADAANAQVGTIKNANSNGSQLDFITGGVTAMTINSAQDLAVDTDTLFVDASADRVGINTASPQGTLHAHLATDKNIRLQVLGAYAGIGALNDDSSSYIQMNLEASDLVVGQYSGGNMGLGVTPSAWLSTIRALQVGDGASVYNAGGAGGDVYFNNNWYVNSSSQNIYLNNGFALSYGQAGGEHRWFTSPSGTAGNTVSFTQAMTLNSTGLGIGTASPSALIHAEAADGAAGGAIKYTATGVASGYLSASTDGTVLATDTADITFRTGVTGNDPTDTGAEAVRIKSTGMGVLCSPSAPLAVASKASTYEGMELVTPSGDGSGKFQFGVHDLGGSAGRGIEFRRGGSDGFDTLSVAIDDAGNLGVGVTPTSGWSGRTALEIEGASTGYVTAPNGPIAIGSNIYYNSGDKFVGNGYAPLYALSSGNHIWYTSNNNTSGAGAAVTLTQSMTLLSSGNLGIGSVNPTTLLELESATGPEITIQRNDTAIAQDDVVGGIRFSSNDSSTDLGSPPHYGAGIKAVAEGTVGFQALKLYAGQDNLGYENDTPNMVLWPSGDVFFYNTTPARGMAWDASASSLGIGIESPSRLLHVNGTEGVARFTSTASGSDGLEVGIGTSSQAFIWQAKNAELQIATNNTQRLNISSAGTCAFTTADINVLFNGTTSSRLLTDNNGVEIYTGGYIWAARQGTSLYLSRSGSEGEIANFRYNALTAVGSISVTSSATAFNTSSDYRLKENLQPIAGAVDRVNALKPQRFNFINSPDVTVDGFLAHEVSPVVPEAITGEKDAVDEKGEPEYQGIDQSKLVPLLTAAIQELTARIEALEAA